MYWSKLLVLALAQFVLASPHARRWDDLAVKHSWTEIPEGWVYHSAPSPSRLLDLRIGMKSHKMDDLITQLYEVSDPKHPKYGQYLSKEEVDALSAPHPDSVEAVEAWLQHHGVNPDEAIDRSGGGDWITLRIPVSVAERMLDTKYGVYHHLKSEDYIVRALSYSLPRELHSHINLVTPTTYFGTIRAMKSNSFVNPDIQVSKEAFVEDVNAPAALPPASCATTVTPACLKAFYNITGFSPVNPASQRIGIAGYLEEFGNRADLQTFLNQLLPASRGFTYTTTLINGGEDDQNDPGVEANLDIQYVVGMAAPIPVTYYSTGGRPPFIPDSTQSTNTNEPYLDWVNFVLAQSTIPTVFTTSYGENEQTIPLDYRQSVCDLFAKLTARGSTILFSSGDSGVGGGDCRTNDGRNRVQFQPAFPASCPFVTAVGGTTGLTETTIGFSGGGFSNTFARPAYQDTAVSRYLQILGNTNAGLFNTTGRAYPDLSAQANRFEVFVGGRAISVGGTSARNVQTVAGIVALINDVRISNGKGVLGFLNPLIYSDGVTGFNDIVTGSNPGCGTNGFPARAGWDPATGLGTPDFAKLRLLLG
ncbi:hypothetical protein PC9H_006402 [Pleurotus ostreatus]|uniref:tripeptidyl-peptidase II n=1 Tax=Pleurotus ostreatus TaxID=5322 RepID=A0A8H7A0U8_PLEOS|nr:uncharacterized protein PC9H_006402 [Pleurotus ostreatus]KAF7430691.1 hypothetical protein PC9H_006402 [Pleurotus ostreatus]